MDTNIIDLVGLDTPKNTVNLVVMDELSWEDPQGHIDWLQEKVLSYTAFIDSGEFARKYPSVHGLDILIKVVFKHEPEGIGMQFVEELQTILEETGYKFEFIKF